MREWRIPNWFTTGLVPVLLASAASVAVLLIPATTETAVANGDTRTIHFLHAHTHESIDATFMVDGRYDPAVLEKLNWFLRDFRRDEATHMDPRLFDVIWEVYREAGSHQPIEVMSAYRSPETNAMLRRRSRSVAEHSQHILGKAMDQHYMDVPMSRIREIAMRLQRGGVGFYPTAGTPFVHMDVGGVRHWPRMSYDQLARLFPDGKTVHIPSNGQPLPGYEVARAELEARGDSFNYPTAGEVQTKGKGFFAWLFGGGDEEGDEGEGAGGRAAPAARRAVASLDRAPVGTTDAAPAGLSGRNDAGIHSFALAEAQTGLPPTSAGPAPSAPITAKGRRGRTQVASLPPTQPPSAEAQQKLADEMQRQQATLEAKRKADADAQAAAQAAASQAAASQAAASQAAASQAIASQAAAAAQARADAQARAAAVPVSAPPAITFDPTGNPDRPLPAAPVVAKADVPLPPRRPVELAIAGPASPLPPARPEGLAPGTDHAPTLRTGVVAALPPSARPDLPTAITRGTAPMPSRVLGFAAAPAPADVPLPVARPQLVAARLDRSNFRSLTSAGFGKGPGRGGLGSAISALRPAARANLGAIATAPSTGAARGFGQHASDLTTDHFSGTALTPSERISTAVLRKPRSDTAPD